MTRDPEALYAQALSRLSYTPTPDQDRVLRELSAFAAAPGERSVFVLNGYAGTGKTSLVGALIAGMYDLKMRSTVLAPTGRAAKVAEKYSARKASTVHRHIYRPVGDPNGAPQYALGKNNTRDTIYIVDEASMVTDKGSKSMLRDLIKFIYSAPGCAMVLVGDEAQLPPVGQDDSPAMNTELLRQLGLNPIYHTLREPARQVAESGILHNATSVRMQIEGGDISLPRLTTRGFPDVKVVSFYDFADEISTSWSQVGKEETIIITRSNRRANDINMALRNQVMYAEEPLARGERLVVSKNNYFWTRNMKNVTFLANGETVVVDWIGRLHKQYGLNFVDTELHIPGREDDIIAAKIMLRSLFTPGPSIPQAEMTELYRRAFAAHPGTISEQTMMALEDEYYNALQVKYAYCVTCHKAQGGQWKHVYIDLSFLMLDMITDETFHRWLYTALTRASEKIFFIHPSIPVEE